MAEQVLTGALYFTIGWGLVLALAAVGELVQEKAGVLNLGLEGVFLAGALGGFTAAYDAHNLWAGYAAGAASGALVGLLFAVLVVILRLNQVVAGILLVALLFATTDVVWNALVGSVAQAPQFHPAVRYAIPLLSDIPVIGPALFDRIVPEYLTLLVLALVSLAIYRTRLGLLIRSVGEEPRAVQFSGHSVTRLRTLAVVVGCAITGMAGSLLTVGQLGLYAPGVTSGNGWIAIAIVIMGDWSVLGVLIGALVFGAAEMLQYEVQASQLHVIPFEFLVAFPYLVAIVALLVRRHAHHAPSALGIPFFARS